jgi:hypothetical protein
MPNTLDVKLLSKFAIVRTPAVLTPGRFVVGWDFPGTTGNQQPARTTVRTIQPVSRRRI